MNSKEDIRPISYIKANAAEILAQAIGLLKLLAQGEQDITTGKVLSQEDFFAEMDNSFDHSRV